MQASSDQPAPDAERTPLGRKLLRSGLLLGVGLYLVVEVSLHFSDPSTFIVYADSDGRSAYRAARQSLDRLEPPELMFVGSSRVREGISAPTIALLAEEKAGRPVRVANYGLAGACADAISALVDRAVAVQAAPRVLCYGVSPTQFRERTGVKRQAEFWSQSDWMDEWEWDRTGELSKVLPGVLRSEMEELSCVLRYRDWFRHGAEHWWTLPASVDNPLQGGESSHHSEEDTRERTDFDVAETRRLLAKYLRGKTLADSQVAHLRQVAETCKEHEIQLVLFEIPFPPTVQALLPRRYLPQFRTRLREISDELGIRWVNLKEMGFEPRDEDFRDRAHLGPEGHLRYSTRVFQKVVRPQLGLLASR